MGDHHHAAAEVFEEVFEHAQGLHIQVVGGLVEQQHVGGPNQQPAEVQPPPLAAGELGHRLVLLGRRKQEALQQLGGTELLAIHRHPAGGGLHHLQHLLVGLEQHVAVLVEVGELHGGAQLQAAAAGLAPAGDHLQQARFAYAIGPDDANPVFRAEVVAEGPQQRPGFGPFARTYPQLLGGDSPLAQPPAAGGQAHLAPALALGCLPHLLNALDAGFLLGAAGLGALPQPGQLPPQGALELRCRGGFRCLLLGLVGEIGGVVAGVAAGQAPIHLHDPAGDPIEHVAVVGHQHQGAGEAPEVALQPLHPVGVEVVGGLIQQQHVGLGHQGCRQGHPLAVATGEVAHLALDVADAEPLQHLAALLLQPPGIELVHAVMEVAELGQGDGVVGAISHRLAQGRVLPQQGHLLAAPGKHLLQHGVLRVQPGLLVDEHHPGAGGAAALAAAEGFNARQHLQQGALAGAIGADQPQPLACADVQAEVFKQGADAEVLAGIHQADQAQGVAPSAPLAWALR